MKCQRITAFIAATVICTAGIGLVRFPREISAAVQESLHNYFNLKADKTLLNMNPEQFIPGLDSGVFTIGELYTIPSGFPEFALSGMEFSFAKVSAVLPDAFTIAILAAIESLLSCVVADSMVNSRHNSNAELVAQGVGNIASVLFGGIPATGAIARTAANAKNGGRTPVAGMVHAIVLLLVLLFLMPLAGLIPMPTIAAILFMVAYNMSEWRAFKALLKAPKSDIIVLWSKLLILEQPRKLVAKFAKPLRIYWRRAVLSKISQ